MPDAHVRPGDHHGSTALLHDRRTFRIVESLPALRAIGNQLLQQLERSHSLAFGIEDRLALRAHEAVIGRRQLGHAHQPRVKIARSESVLAATQEQCARRVRGMKLLRGSEKFLPVARHFLDAGLLEQVLPIDENRRRHRHRQPIVPVADTCIEERLRRQILVEHLWQGRVGRLDLLQDRCPAIVDRLAHPQQIGRHQVVGRRALAELDQDLLVQGVVGRRFRGDARAGLRLVGLGDRTLQSTRPGDVAVQNIECPARRQGPAAVGHPERGEERRCGESAAA